MGCSKNTVDSEVIAGNVKAAGWTILKEENPRAADVTLVNTCGFILDAKQESIDAVLAEVARKNRRKKGKVYVMGCLVQRYGKELAKEIPGVDIWRGVNDLNAVVDAILQAPVEADATVRNLSTPAHYAYLKVSEGCNRLIHDNKAALLLSADDLMKAMMWEGRDVQTVPGNVQRSLFPELSEEEASVVRILMERGELHINTLVVASNIPVNRMSALLFELEMKGVVKALAGSMYRLV